MSRARDAEADTFPLTRLGPGLVRTSPRCRAAIHIARRNGQLVAALPLVVRRHFGLRIASFVGDDHPFVDLLLAAGESLETARALTEYAAQSHDCASLGMISAESVIAKTCAKRLRLVPRVDSPILDLDRDFESVYREKYSTKARQAIVAAYADSRD